jgi:FkbM family methyltransferase
MIYSGWVLFRESSAHTGESRAFFPSILSWWMWEFGQFSLFSREYLKAERVVSIEPIPSCYQLLCENAAQPSDCFNVLVSDDERLTPFYVARDSQLSSAVRSAEGVYDDEIIVRGVSLDRLLEERGVGAIDLLKIDTEGSELAVLRSAERALKETKAVLVEMSILRENSGDLFAVGSFLEARGFHLHDFAVTQRTHPGDADGVFLKV